MVTVDTKKRPASEQRMRGHLDLTTQEESEGEFLVS